MSLPEILQEFDDLDKSSPWFPRLLDDLLSEEGLDDYILELRDEGISWLVEYLDHVCLRIVLYPLTAQVAQALDTLDSTSSAYRKCLGKLASICGIRNKLPWSCILDGSLMTGDNLVTREGRWDVYQGSLNGSMVRVKRPMAYGQRNLNDVHFEPNHLSLLAPLTKPTDDPLQGFHVETFEAPEHRSLHGRHSHTSSGRFDLGFWHGTEGVYYHLPRNGPTRSCGYPPSLVSDYA